MNGVKILPGLPQELLHRSAEEVSSFLVSSDGLAFLVPCEINNDEDIVVAIDFPNAIVTDNQISGDTVTVYHDEARMFKMTFLDFQGRDQKHDYNLLASILHNSAHKVWGTVLITCIDRKTDMYLPVKITDIPFLVYRRAWHKGLYYKNGSDTPSEVEIDNGWNIKGQENTLTNKRKNRVMLTDNAQGIKVCCDESGDYWMFALLEENGSVLIDLEMR